MFRRIVSLLLVSSVLVLPAWAASESDRPSLEEVDAALAAAANYAHADDRAYWNDVKEAVKASRPGEPYRKALSRRLAAFLESDATVAGKELAARVLSRIGHEEAVGAGKALLASADTFPWGRWVLERIPMPEADAALIDALETAGLRQKIGLVNTLGNRKSAPAVTAIAPFLRQGPPELAEAALVALLKIGTDDAVGVVMEAKDELPGGLAKEFEHFLVIHAARLLEQGRDDAALAMYNELYQPDAPRYLRIAALRGKLTALGEDALPVAAERLGSGDEAAILAALDVIPEMPGEDIAAPLLKTLDALPVPHQLSLLGALAERGEQAALPYARELAKSKDEEVREKALTIARMLDPYADVRNLVKAIVNASSHRERKEAQERLDSMDERDLKKRNMLGTISRMLLKIAGESDPEIAAEAVRSVGLRGADELRPELLAMLNQDDLPEALRVALMETSERFLGNTGLPVLLNQLDRDLSAGELQALERALLHAAEIYHDLDERTALLLDHYERASSPEKKAVLLRVMAYSVNQELMMFIVDEALSGDKAIRDAAVRAAASWQTQAAVGPLINLAQSTENERHRVLLVRTIVRLISTPDPNRTPEIALSLFRQVLELAERPQEKQLVISQMANVETPKILEMLEDFLAQPQTAAAAARAYERAVRQLAGVSTCFGRPDAEAVFDQDATTAWPAGPECCVVIDLGQPYKVHFVILETAGDSQGPPVEYTVSVDSGPGSLPFAAGKSRSHSGKTKISLGSVTGRYIEINAKSDTDHSAPGLAEIWFTDEDAGAAGIVPVLTREENTATAGL